MKNHGFKNDFIIFQSFLGNLGGTGAAKKDRLRVDVGHTRGFSHMVSSKLRSRIPLPSWDAGMGGTGLRRPSAPQRSRPPRPGNTFASTESELQ